MKKADYTYKYTVIRQAGQPTHLPVICSIPGSLQTKIITRKYAQGNHFHNVLCLSEAKGMNINMINTTQANSREMDNALKALEQAKARVANERKK